MKKRNTLLILGVLLASVGLAACSSSMNTKGKGIAQLMNDNQERVFYTVIDSNHDGLPGKDEDVEFISISKQGKLKAYEVELIMDDVVGKNINEIKKLAEEKSKKTYKVENIKATVDTDSSGNNPTFERIYIASDGSYQEYASLTNRQIRDKYYSGYVARNSIIGFSGPEILITEVSKGDSINFDKVDGKIVTEIK